MTLILHPDFRLIEGGAGFGAGDIAMVARLLKDQVPAGSRVVYAHATGADMGRVFGLLAVIAACQQVGADLYIERDPSARPVSSHVFDGNEILETGDVSGGRGLVWLQTSGSTGKPKWVSHSLSALTARLAQGRGRANWLLTYAPQSFAGMQVILSALQGHTLTAPSAGDHVTDMAELAIAERVTHISATPTFWRSFLLALGAQKPPLKSLTLGGEVADQALLDALHETFPDAPIRHIYATTEAGVIFSVGDIRAGFPAAWLDTSPTDTILTISDHGTLIVTNPHASEIGLAAPWDTGDTVEIRGDRVVFKGRSDSMVNIGGVKVWPEEVEAHILKLPFIQDVQIFSKPSPITGHVLLADIVLRSGMDETAARTQIGAHLTPLPRSAHPARLTFRDSLTTGGTGKKLRGAS